MGVGPRMLHMSQTGRGEAGAISEARVRVRIAGKCPKKPESNCKRVVSGYAHRRCMRRLVS